MQANKKTSAQRNKLRSIEDTLSHHIKDIKDLVHQAMERRIKDFLFLQEVLIKLTGNQVHWMEEDMSVCRIKG